MAGHRHVAPFPLPIGRPQLTCQSGTEISVSVSNGVVMSSTVMKTGEAPRANGPDTVVANDRYIFTYDRARRLLKLKFMGVWDEAALHALTGETAKLRDSVEEAGHRDENGRLLLDLSDCPVQPRGIAESLAQLLPRLGDRLGRVAVVRSSSALHHLQMQRLLTGEKVRIFDSTSDADMWLREE